LEEIDVQMGAKPYFEVINMIYKNAIQTNRAFIHFDKIQHVSWSKDGVTNELTVKIYSASGYIIVFMTEKERDKFLYNYGKFKGVEA
tara:strand:- start:4254 stop:4514 length:261 start_codon:yes stop_codon:yes gene_type:complete